MKTPTCDCGHSNAWHGRDGCGFPDCACQRVPVGRRNVEPGQKPGWSNLTMAQRRAIQRKRGG